MRIIGFAALLVVAACPARTEQVALQVDPARTRVAWTLGASLHTVHGSFRLKHGEVTFDPESGKVSGALVVDAASGESGNSGRDSKMHQSVLESARFPEITFRPERLEGKVNLAGESDAVLHGGIEIHRSVHPLSVNVHSRFEQGQVDATIRFTVPYVQWGMKNPSTFLLKVNQTVDIEIKVAGTVGSR
jgi:polyisoprenoid-binding protein YceI